MLLGMSACGRKALTLLSSVFAVCGLGLLGISVSTDYWLYLEEGIVQPQNQTAEIKLSLHAGLWRVCFLAGIGMICCCSAGPCCPRGSSPATPRSLRPSQSLGSCSNLLFVPATLGFRSAETSPPLVLVLMKQFG